MGSWGYNLSVLGGSFQLGYVVNKHGHCKSPKKGCGTPSNWATKKKALPSTSWWFQPIWKILVKMGIFPK